jgi:hypothetical protein
MSWSRSFDVPIVLADGSALATLREAGEFVTSLPAAEQKKPHWQTAAREWLLAAEQGGILMAEIAMRRALGHEKPETARTSRKKAAKKYGIVR